MAVDLEKDEVLSSAIEGIPKIAELITTVPDEKRSLALQAAHQSYLQTARALGYAPPDAEEWASTVMSMLEIASLASERTAQKVSSDN
ncbi:MAG: hypothetical protein WBD11_17155 [Xanthobacteraceae bacterium]|jgi:hypothetical protein